MQLKILQILFILFSNFLIAQDSCDGRYSEEIFEDVEVTTVTYSDIHNLQMDIYRPVGDTETNRPLIIFAHGGTFIFGSKNNPTAVDFCEAFAKRGFVTASINYRLANDIVGFFQQFTFYTNTDSAYEVVLNATMDGKAAIRYFRKDFYENNNTYGIDPNQIWAGGNSAGGVLFLHAAHVESVDEFISPLDSDRAAIAQSIFDELGGVEGNSGNQGFSSSVSGVISLAGALHRSEYIDMDDVPSVFCHGDADGVVPYDCNGFQNNPNYDQLCGGGSLYPEFSSFNLETNLLTFPGDGHCPWESSSAKMNQVISFVSQFVYDNLECSELITNLNEIIKKKNLTHKLNLLGQEINNHNEGFSISVFDDGSTEKKYILKY